MEQRKPYEEYEEKIYTNKLACLSKNSRLRKYDLTEDGYRSPFQRDVHRITYSQPFRRLRHKTQVFFLTNNDHVCTRLEHSLYVAHASRTVARHLGLNEDLAEAIGLGHDLGHAPFGHLGETVLRKIAEKNEEIDFDFQHELNSLRMVDELGLLDRYNSPGLNLTYEVRDGIVSHCGEKYERILLPTPTKEKLDLEKIKNRDEAGNPTTLEGCIVRMVDKIAYIGRDLEDAVQTKLISPNQVPSDIKTVLGGKNRDIIRVLLEDLINESRIHGSAICLSEAKHEKLMKLRDFNFRHIYNSKRVENFKENATAKMNSVFSQLCEDLEVTDKLTKSKDKLPKSSVYDVLEEFIKQVRYPDKASAKKIVFDFLCGMTDNYVELCLNSILKI